MPFTHGQIKGSAIGISSNLEGGFELKLCERYLNNQRLLFSYIDYIDAEIELSPTMNRTLQIRLTSSVKSLDEVVIKGPLSDHLMMEKHGGLYKGPSRESLKTISMMSRRAGHFTGIIALKMATM
ncbi:MAG: hypothetical protein AAGC88_17600 [Bacteroidota bacterium]